MDKVKKFRESIEKKQTDKFDIGDTVVVSVRIQEEGKSRIQDFEGVVIGRKRGGINSTFTVRRISYGEGVERVFPIHSPRVEKVTVKRKGKTRRAKLYYLRKSVGGRLKVDEKIGPVSDSGENALPREEGA
ncbi:MAG: 50S ribosomal protein L19 [Candidatus Omnitrophota bacterium]